MAVTNDAINGDGSVAFITITEGNDILKSEINYTKLEDLQMIDNQLVLLNCYENVDDNYKMWLIALYDLNGRCKKTILDKKVRNDEWFRTQVVVNKKGMLVVWVDKILPDGEEKKFTDYDLKILAPNLPAPERKVTWLEKRRLKKEKKIKAEKESKKPKEIVAEEEPPTKKTRKVKKEKQEAVQEE